MKLLYVVLVLVLVGSATTTTYFTYYTATFYTTDIFQLENKVASLESEILSLKSSTVSDLKNAYDDGYSAELQNNPLQVTRLLVTHPQVILMPFQLLLEPLAQ